MEHGSSPLHFLLLDAYPHDPRKDDPVSSRAENAAAMKAMIREDTLLTFAIIKETLGNRSFTVSTFMHNDSNVKGICDRSYLCFESGPKGG